jgi:hypothetical protein
VTFDGLDRAASSQRLSSTDPGILVGMEIDQDPRVRENTLRTAADAMARRNRFFDLLPEHQPEAVAALIRILTAWEKELGGELRFGAVGETSCARNSTWG